MNALPPIPASKYLIDDRPLVVKLQLVRLIGFKAAVVLQQVRYWLGEDRRPQIRDGHPWVYNTYPDWQKQFPFWPVSTIKETFLELEREGLLLSGHFNARNTDRTKWYTIPPHVIRDLDRRARADAAPRARRRGEEGALPALPESALLIDRDTLIILPRLAATIGLNEAIVLQQVFYWLGGDRKPHVRDGRRWVYNTYEGWREQFPFWSERTIRRTIRDLEQLGLLESTFFADHPEHRHLDHTKWYTVGFDRLAALEADAPTKVRTLADTDARPPLEPAKKRHSEVDSAPARSGQEAPIDTDNGSRTKRPESDDGIGHEALMKVATSLHRNRPGSAGGVAAHDRGGWTESADEAAKSRHCSLTETTPEITTQSMQKQQQLPATGESGIGQGDSVVVAVDPQSELVARLVERGVTRSVASKLAVRHSPTTVADQIEIFDWLREVDPDDARYGGGRLRRMIEEVWTPPPGFESAAQREERERAAAEAASRAREERARWAAEHEARRVREEADRRAALAQIGVTEEDQEAWRRILDLPRPLASPLVEPLRRALFYAPRDGAPALVIFRDEADLALAGDERHARGRAEIDRRVAAQFRLPLADVRYAPYARIVSLLHDGGDGVPEAAGSATPADSTQNGK